MVIVSMANKKKFKSFLYDDTVQLFLLISFIASILVLASVYYNHEKQECIESGGKWVTGFVTDKYAAFCIPK